MTVLAYEEFVLPWAEPAVRTMIERVPSDPRLAGELQRYKRLAHEGWSVSALLAPDSRSVVLLACREETA